MHTDRIQNPSSVSSSLTVAIQHGERETAPEASRDRGARSPRLSPRWCGNTLRDETRSHAPTGLLLCALLVLLTLMLGWVNADPANATPGQRLHPDRSCRAVNLTAMKAIKCYWPERSRAKALEVAQCESTANAPERIARQRSLGRWARNGVHVGIFQMGRTERRAHGWYVVGDPARVQVRSAISLFRDRGFQPWNCA